MHEVGLVSDALARAVAAAERAGATRIDRLSFAIAGGGHVTPEIVETLCAALGAGTLADGARVECEPLAVDYACFVCGATFHDTDGTCPICGSPGVSSDDAPELELVSIDVTTEGGA